MGSCQRMTLRDVSSGKDRVAQPESDLGITASVLQTAGSALAPRPQWHGEQDLNSPTTNSHHASDWRRTGTTLIALALGLICPPVQAGTLTIGKPVVQNNQYTFPVNLQGNGEGVAALDFRLAYDPAVFSPVSAQIGVSAATAQKQVSSNVAAPGEFIVVMMGFNQNVVEPGTVVEVVLEKIGEPATGQSELLIAEPTMATYEGVEIDSSGQARVVQFGEEKTEDDPTEETPPVDKDTDSESPEIPAEGEVTPDAQPGGNFRFIVAEETENKKVGGTASAVTGNGAAGETPPTLDGASDATSTGGASTAGLPPGAPATSGPTESVDSEPLAKTAAASAPSAAGGSQTDAVITTPTQPENSEDAPLDPGTGNRGVVFVTLFLLAAALPITVLVVLKVLR